MPPPRIRPFLARLTARYNSPRSHAPFFSQRYYGVSPLLSNFRIHQSNALNFGVRDMIWSFTITCQLFLIHHFLWSYVVRISPTSGISMVPTIPHEWTSRPWILVILLRHRHGRNIAVGDVVSYKISKENSGAKRVIGMPGDFVSVVSRGRQEGDMDKDDDEGDWAHVKEEFIRVPEGHCWLEGDNMEWSRDSRVYGPVPLNMVDGKVMAVVWPPSAWKMLGREEVMKEPADKEHDTVVTR